MARSLARLIGTLIAGTLDILAAVGLTLICGRDPMAMLRYVASGPFPPATEMGAPGSLLGLSAAAAPSAGSVIPAKAGIPLLLPLPGS